MANSLFMFSIQGCVWANQAQGILYKNNDIIKITNPRNGLTDSDVIGVAGGNCADPGWYSVTLASLSNNQPNVAVVGDVFKIVIVSEKDYSKQLFDLGTYTIVTEDIKTGGVVINFDLALTGKE